MRPIIPSRKFDLVEPIGIGTGLVEASSSLWKRAAERSCVSFCDFARWAFEEMPVPLTYPHRVTGKLAQKRKWLGIDGLAEVAEVYLAQLSNFVAAESIEACTLLPFAGLLCEKRLLRRYRTWCPLCLAAMLSGPGVYEPLLWRLQDVTVCPIHRVHLVECCNACRAPHQYVFSRIARVGCCNRCGAWMGTEEAALELRHADELEAKVSHVIFDLLAKTGEFVNPGVDGRLTYRKFVASTKMRNKLASILNVQPEILTKYACNPRLPRLMALATVASASRQPLCQVIIGELASWESETWSSQYTLKGRPKRNWEVIERQFEKIASGRTFVNLGDACKIVNISMGSARIHFPYLVAAITQRGVNLRSKHSKSKKIIRAEKIRKAFRYLISVDEYPAKNKLQDIADVSSRDFSVLYKDVIDEEWRRVGGMEMQGRIRRVSR